MAQRFLISGVPGLGKSLLSKRVAKDLGWHFQDPEESLEKERKERVSSLVLTQGAQLVRQRLLDHLVEAIHDHECCVVPCPPLLAIHPGLKKLLGESVIFLLLEGMPMVSYEQAFSREMEEGADYLPSKERGEIIQQKKDKWSSKLSFYQRYWLEVRKKMAWDYRLRVFGELERDVEALRQKIEVIEAHDGLSSL